MGKHRRQSQANASAPNRATLTGQAYKNAVANSIMVAATMSLAPEYNPAVTGRIMQANASLFTDSHFSESLTTYSVGWKDDMGLDEALDFFAPAVPVAKRFEYREHDNADSFESDVDDSREIHGDFKSIREEGKLIDASTKNHGLMIIVDRDEVDDDPNWRERKVGKLLARVKRNSLIRAINMLKAAAVDTPLTWDTSAGKDPDQDVDDMLVESADDSGISANRVGYGHTAWQKRKKSHRPQDTAGGYGSAKMTPSEVGDYLNAEQVLVTKPRQQQGVNKSLILADEVIAFHAANGLDTEDPSNIKRFTTSQEGGQYRVYEWEIGPNLIAIAVSHYELIKLTSIRGLRKLSIS